MLRTRLLTATAAIALFGAGSAFAQDAQAPASAPAAPVAQSAPSTVPSEAAAPVESATPSTANTVVDVLRANGQFSTLLSALDAAQLTETLQTQSAISIFAPTDAAFAALPEAERTRLLDPANVNDLRQLLLYHVIVADVNSSQIQGTKGGVETAARTQVELDGTGSSIMVDEATVTTADLDASNGAVFVIDQVLSPATSQVAVGDASESETVSPQSGGTTTPTTPPASGSMTETTPPTAPAGDAMTPPPADGSMTGDDMDNDSATTTGETAPTPDDMTTAPAGSTSVSPTPGTTTAPNGQPATTTTTTSSPPVENPTDGQTDEATDTPAPTPQS